MRKTVFELIFTKNGFRKLASNNSSSTALSKLNMSNQVHMNRKRTNAGRDRVTNPRVEIPLKNRSYLARFLSGFFLINRSKPFKSRAVFEQFFQMNRSNTAQTAQFEARF